MTRAAVLALATALAAVAGTGRAAAQQQPPQVAVTPPPWVPAFIEYAKDPSRNQKVLRAFRGVDPATLPPAIVIALGDANLRAGRRRTAAALFRQVLDTTSNEPLKPLANLGLLWVALFDDDAELAQTQLDALAGFAPARHLGPLLGGLTLAGTDASSAAATLDAAPRTPDHPQLDAATREAAALARWWAGDPQAALTRFSALAAAPDAGRFADDGAYGAAVMEWVLGRPDAARSGFERLAAGAASPEGRRPSRARLLLQRGAVLREGYGRMRATNMIAIDEQVVTMLDGDGPRLAVAALALLDAAPDAPAEEAAARARGEGGEMIWEPAADAPEEAPAGSNGPTGVGAVSDRPAPATPESRPRGPLIVVIGVLLAAVVLLWSRRPRRVTR